MTRLIIDETLRAKLHNLTQTLILCDETGQVFGHFVPAVDLSQWEPVSPGISDEELRRRAQSKERRYTTAEVLARLAAVSRAENS